MGIHSDAHTAIRYFKAQHHIQYCRIRFNVVWVNGSRNTVWPIHIVQRCPQTINYICTTTPLTTKVKTSLDYSKDVPVLKMCTCGIPGNSLILKLRLHSIQAHVHLLTCCLVWETITVVSAMMNFNESNKYCIFFHLSKNCSWERKEKRREKHLVTRYVVVNLLALVQVNSTNPIFHLKSLTTNANISLFIFFMFFFLLFGHMQTCRHHRKKFQRLLKIREYTMRQQ